MIALGGVNETTIAQAAAAHVQALHTGQCTYCSYKASMAQCRCKGPCGLDWCLAGELSLDALPGTLHEIIPVPRFQ